MVNQNEDKNSMDEEIGWWYDIYNESKKFFLKLYFETKTKTKRNQSKQKHKNIVYGECKPLTR